MTWCAAWSLAKSPPSSTLRPGRAAPTRRLVRFASEDVGLADPHALTLAMAAQQAVHFIGQPEGDLALAELYLDRGWGALAAEKLTLLGRLADLAGEHPRIVAVDIFPVLRELDGVAAVWRLVLARHVALDDDGLIAGEDGALGLVKGKDDAALVEQRCL